MDIIKEYFKNKSLIKTPKVGVHYEQKITPDLIWCVADVISGLIKGEINRIFTDEEVRESTLYNSLMSDYFSKAPQAEAESEYDKLSSYQLGVMAFAGILKQVGERPKKYQVANIEILSFIAVNDFNSSIFLCEYTDKFIKDNGLDDVFNSYKNTPNQDNYIKAKEAYWNWAKVNTAVKGEDRKHTYRVFNKMFNVFCYKNHIPGEDASNITTGPCPYSFLIYNRENFRDKNMPTGMTRQQYQAEVLLEIETGGLVETLLRKVKDSIRFKYGGESEIREASLGYTEDSRVHIHHILPRHSYEQFSLSEENLIALTPGQHLSFAHTASTNTINPDYQKICLKYKFNSIKSSINNGEEFYDLKEFIKILNACLGIGLDENLPIITIEKFISTI